MLRARAIRSGSGFFWLRLILTIGWALYPLSYLIVRLGSGADVAKLMVIYNLADLINQIAFVSGPARHRDERFRALPLEAIAS